MDVQRTDLPRMSRRRTVVAVTVLGLCATTALAMWRSPEPAVALSEVVVDTAELAPLVLEVRGSGTLVPEQLQWITAPTSARVDRVVVQSGAVVAQGDPLLVLVNPDVEIQALQAEQQLGQAEAQLLDLRLGLRQQVLSQEGAIATMHTQLQDAEQQADAADSLLLKDLISRFDARSRRALASELTTRMRIEQERLALLRSASDSQVAQQAAQVQRLRAIAEFQQHRLGALLVRAVDAGVVQDLSVQPGQWVTEGTMLAKVVQPGRLKAVLRVAESQAKDVSVGQHATIDTRTATIRGVVARKDPAAQAGYLSIDVALPDQLPSGAVPDLSVDGVIAVANLGEVLVIGRPSISGINGMVHLFRIGPDDTHATRVAVQLGRASLTQVHVERGLAPGDQVILSDLPGWSGAERIRLKRGSTP